MSRLESRNPATGLPIGDVPVTPVDAIAGIVRDARAAQAPWARTTPEERARIIIEAASGLADRADELGTLLTKEMGKPLREGIGEVQACSDVRETVAEISDAIRPVRREGNNVRSTIHYDPLGVCAAITPWNFPMMMPHWHVIPALMAGNAVVLKPSEETPLIAQAYVDTLNERLPKDLLNVVHGDEAQGRALVAADVDLITFTGSREAGKHILAAASAGLKRVILELGGKDPLIVLEGADIPAAAAFAARNAFRNAGQVCVSTERIYVNERVMEPFLDAMLRETQALLIGDGLSEATQIGPMINHGQRDHVMRQISDATEAGAGVLCGGQVKDDHWIAPTILTGVTHAMDIAREETFGPVACILPVANDDETIRLANDTPFGLGAVVFGEEAHAHRVARSLTAGMIGVNRGLGGAPNTPWVGAGESGYGFHHSTEGHRQFCQVRVISEPG